jgi:hypothetical protein
MSPTNLEVESFACRLPSRSAFCCPLSVWQSSSAFSESERAAMTWCEALTHLPTITDDAYEDVSARFDDEEVVGLTVAIIAINAWNRLRVGLDGPKAEHEHLHSPPFSTRPVDPRALELAEHLRRLESEISQVREEYRRAVSGPPSPRYYESGTIHPELDDQGITP